MEKEDYVIVSLEKYLKANNGKINPVRRMVFNYYQRGSMRGVDTFTSIIGYVVTNVKIRRNRNECTGIVVPDYLFDAGKKKTCKIRNIHVEMPLALLVDPKHK